MNTRKTVNRISQAKYAQAVLYVSQQQVDFVGLTAAEAGHKLMLHLGEFEIVPASTVKSIYEALDMPLRKKQPLMNTSGNRQRTIAAAMIELHESIGFKSKYEDALRVIAAKAK